MIPEIIPINFMGGSGGSFLNTWLTISKYQFAGDLEFTKFGSMHTHRYIELPMHTHMFEHDLQDKIDHIKQLKFLPTYLPKQVPPYFTTIHADVCELKNYFTKIINITYQSRDAFEMAACWMLKYQNDTTKINSAYFKETLDFILLFKNSFTNTDNDICNVSWHEMFHSKNTDQLIEKLSSYTGIPKSNFNVDYLLAWRNKSSETIELVNNLIQKNIKIFG